MDFRRGISIGITGTLGVLKLGGLSKFRFRCHSQVVSSFLTRIFKSGKELLSLVTNSAQIIYNMLRNSFFSEFKRNIYIFHKRNDFSKE